MLAFLLAIGVIGPEIDAGTGPIIAVADRTVTMVVVGSNSPSAAQLPLGAYRWPSPFDPSDRAPYAMKWNAMLAADETVADIVQLTMSAAGAALGLEIDGTPGRAPIIATDGKAIQLWFRCTDPENPAFAGEGVSIGIAALIRTSADPFKQYERTAVLTVRQQ